MTKYILKRLGTSLLILLLGSLLLYVLVINSGDPLSDLRESNDKNRDNLIAQRVANMGLDRPWYERYWDWLTGASKCLIGQCDLGLNRAGQSVNDLTLTAAGSTLRLVVLATILAIVVGVLLGVVTAVRQYSGFDYGITLMAFVFFSLPVFWLAVLLKHYAAIEFNNWIVEAAIRPSTMAIAAILIGVVIQAAMGGDLKRRLITFGATAAGLAAVLFYFDAVTWFRRPAIGLPVFILATVGIGIMVVVMTSGLGNKRVRNAVFTSVVAGVLGYGLLRGTLMNNPSTGLLLLCFVVALAIAIVSGFAWGGFSRKQAIMASVVTALLSSAIALADLLLSNWSAYLKLQPRPMPTIGSQTPNVTFEFWGGWIDVLTHLALPTIALTLISLAGYTRYTRASMLEVLNQDYIRTARSKGISERKVITKHALRNSLIPLATIVAFDFAGLIGGAVITERVFGWQGMGNMFAVGLSQVDPAPVMAFFLVTGTAAVLMNLMADLTYAFLDPRITR